MDIRLISKQCSLDTEGLDKFKDLPCNKQVELMTQWAYKIGLLLDEFVLWAGVSNFERIETAIREYLELKNKPNPNIIAPPFETLSEG